MLQGARVEFAPSVDRAAEGRLDIGAMDRRDDLEAEAKHYRRRVEELQETVDDLRDELEVQRSSRELAHSAEQIEAAGRRAAGDVYDDEPPSRRGVSGGAPGDSSESRNELLAQLREFEETNR